ncbi:MAG: PD40 domain-containing protein [Gemmatimonadota bacterium]|nr:MAG: PD40 domain-containing protein [Gemmatimonadota bacterium]
MRTHRLLRWSIPLVLALALIPSRAVAQTKLLRFPDIHGDQVVFVYAGDLWVTPATGGTATRLTAHPGLELFPKFSPDGEWIAFTGQYDGDEQVYVIPATGGVPKQLTYYPARGPLAPRWGYDNQVYGWTRDGTAVLFRSLRGEGWDLTDSRLYTVLAEGGFPEALPMPIAGAGDFSPDARKVVYSYPFRDFRAWKRHEGGWAQNVYIFDLATNEAEQITDHPRADRDPMWIGELIYFASDRDGTLNLYSYDPTTDATAQLTRSTTWDVRWPSADEEARIVYELNGELVIYDVSADRSIPISITVPDDGVAMRPARVSAARNVEDYELSPKGERAVFVARGDVFTAPIEHGPTRNLTYSSNAHDKHARWSPDGSKIAFVSDMSGEEEIYLINQDGSGVAEQLTSGSVGMLYAPAWSPDGEHIAYSDKEGVLYVVNVNTKRKREIADERQGQLFGYTWSPNGGHLAFTLNNPSGFNSIYIYSMEDGELHRVTDEMFNEFSLAWDPGGNYLFYIADRQYAPTLGSFEFNYVVDREHYIYALALRRDVPHPFPPQSDEVTIEGEAEEEEEEEGDAKEPIRIDFDGLAERVARVPVGQGNYGGLSAVEGSLIYIDGLPFVLGASSGQEPSIKIFSLEDREEKTLLEGVGNYALSSDGKKILVRQAGSYNLYDVKPDAAGTKKTISTAGLSVDRVPAQEWAQIFDEVWRRFRDWFYVENMHGYDWEALREQYRPWLTHVAHRSDLNYVMGEMIAELNVSHAYISGGDYEIPERPRFALLGAQFELDDGSGRYRIARIYEGDNHEDNYRSPLTEIGIDVSVGDYVLAIDGEELQAPENIYRVLRHKAGVPLTLTVNGRPSMSGAREVTVRPVSSELSLKYYSWVAARRRQVEEATDGRVGYLHVPDMGTNGIREFIKWFYGQVRKEGLVIDVRGNGGGFVSQMLIDRLRRELLGTSFSRTFEWPGTYPGTVFHGHMVCLINETSASDGDIFPAAFRQAGLGPLIGKRTWGGVVGYTEHGSLIDGGDVYVPQFGTNDVDGSWIIENYGVAPDVEVENTPKSVIEGRDLQLERAIQEVMDAIRRDPRTLPEQPADPVKTN